MDRRRRGRSPYGRPFGSGNVLASPLDAPARDERDRPGTGMEDPILARYRRFCEAQINELRAGKFQLTDQGGRDLIPDQIAQWQRDLAQAEHHRVSPVSGVGVSTGRGSR